MTTIEKTQIPHNFSKEVEWVFGAYEDAGVDLANGFQKDCIQNCAGARKVNSWKDWNCNIYLKETEKGLFLVVEDSGTQGLTGPNISATEIKHRMDANEYFDSDYRLARFSSMHNSGGNATGAGTYGVGKIIYAVGSKNYSYYFDSLTVEEKYVANMLDNGNIFEKAYEGKEAEKFIKDNTGFEPKTTVGTRVIIVNPKDELVGAINDGTMVKYIQETWWRIIERLEDKSSAIAVNGEKVHMVNQPECVQRYDLPTSEIYRDGYRVKHFGLYVFSNKENIWSGVSYYRKGMKIGDVEISDIPDKIKGKFWGFVEVDEDWENELAEIEDKVHFGVSKGKKLKNAYQYLKKYSAEKFRKLMVEWNYIKDKENEDRKLQEEIQAIAEEIQNLFDSLGFEDLGKGPKKPDFDVRWQNIAYPTKGSVEVKLNDKISFDIRIKSDYIANKKFEYSLIVVDNTDKTVVSNICAETINVEPNCVFTNTFTLDVTEKNARRFAENRVILKVSAQGSGKVKTKELPFFFDISKPDNSRKEVILTLNSCTFPRTGNRRINFDETLKEIAYRVENKRPDDLEFQMNVSIHDAREASCPKLIDIGSYTGIVGPYEETVIDIPDITFWEEVYEKFLNKGELELRARIIAAEDSGEYEKGDRITKYIYKLFFNCDEKNGKSDAFQTRNIDAPDDVRRSWYETNGIGKIICLNTAHVAYMFVADLPDMQRAYIKEQMLKQYVFLYLHEQKYSMFNVDGKKLEEMDILESNEAVNRKFESVLAASFK
ncbi:hypothetical protein [Clostridium kluyveri]|uniref:Uncharacterized protein n=1 Tax=Clostridium kluyveri TaxID=1534 RepID=A0A1L5FA77_CLOKL|nr:hypothetical protein [Clostridium kluyveri]APM39904.1 hypothetical protein BS101_14790 [Clostridium kluyveri]